MKKDIFIDNNRTQFFSNPIDEGYKKLIDWLSTYNQNEEEDAYLVVSPFLMKEYNEGNRYPNSRTNIVQIVADMTKQDRLVRFNKKEIEDYQKQHFSKKVLKKLRTANTKDINHIPAILLSERKMVLTEDINLTHDLNLFDTVVAVNPDDLDYLG